MVVPIYRNNVSTNLNKDLWNLPSIALYVYRNSPLIVKTKESSLWPFFKLHATPMPLSCSKMEIIGMWGPGCKKYDFKYCCIFFTFALALLSHKMNEHSLNGTQLSFVALLSLGMTKEDSKYGNISRQKIRSPTSTSVRPLKYMYSKLEWDRRELLSPYENLV